VVGLVSGPAPALLVVVLLLLLKLRRERTELRKLCAWLHDPRTDAVPLASGPWENAYALLTRTLRSQRQQENTLSAALQRFQRAGAALPDGMVILDEEDTIQWCNPAAERHLGVDFARDAGHQIT